MIIQVALIGGLVLSFAYAFLQRRKSPVVAVFIGIMSIAGIYFVLFPEQSSDVAHLLGVGRGADLILYCWIVISLFVSINLQLKILNLQGAITTLTRELALRAPKDGSL